MSSDNEQLKVLITGVRILSELFWGPNLQKCNKILSGDYFKPFANLESTVDYNLYDVLQKIESTLKNFTDPDSLFQYLESNYVQLFVSHRGGIAAPLYESCYVGIKADETASLMGEPAVRMRRCLETSGLAIDSRLSEPPDHISIELEYLYFLLEKGWVDDNRALITEAASFATEIMFPWVTKFHDRLVAETKCHFYRHIAAILCATLKAIGTLGR